MLVPSRAVITTSVLPARDRLALAAALAALATVAACGGRYGAPAPAAHATEADAPASVAAAALPFAIVDGRSGREVAVADFWSAIDRARVVCAGELHPSPHDHWAQLQLLDHMSGAPATGLGLGLGLEMIQGPFQGVLDDWSAARIDEAALLSRTGWADRWNIDFALYRPMLELARSRGAAVVALNAPSELVARVAEVGVDGLGPADGARLPALELADAQHRAWFDGVMAALAAEHGGAHGHGAHGHGSGDNVYAAQVVRDEWMADTAARWLATGSRMLVLAGTGHCHDSAIVRRLGRRGVTGVVSVHPIVDDGQGNVAAALAEGINDFLLVMTPAPRP